MDARSQELLVIVSNTIGARTGWINSDSAYITEAFEGAITELVESFRDGDIPAITRTHLEQVARLKLFWEEWQDRAIETGNPNELPTSEFWSVMDEIEATYNDIYDPPKGRKMETLEELEKQECTDHQICTIYGWLEDSTGGPQYWKLTEERESPGKHLNASFANPAEVQREERKLEAEQARSERNRKLEDKLAAANTEAPETVEELAAQGITARQISLMKNIPVIEINRICDEAGVERPAADYPHVNQMRGVHDPEPNSIQQRILDAMTVDPVNGEEYTPAPAEAYTAGELLDNYGAEDGEPAEQETEAIASDWSVDPAASVDSNVIQLHQSGLKNGMIAEALSSEDHPVSIQRVNGVLRRFKNDPAQFEGV